MSDEKDPQADASASPSPPTDGVGETGFEPEVEGPTGAAAIFGPFFNSILAPAETWNALDAKPRLGLWIALWVAVLTTVTEVIKLPASLPASLAMARQQIEAAGGEVTAQSLGTIETWTRVSAYAFTPIMMFIVLAVTATAIWVFGSIMGGTGATFGRCFALASAGGVIRPFLNNVYITTILRLNPPVIRRPEDMMQLQPSLGLDLLVPTSDASIWLTTLLKRIDLFSIWWIVLVSAGAVPLLKLSNGKGRAIAFIIWALGTVIAMGFASLFAA